MMRMTLRRRCRPPTLSRVSDLVGLAGALAGARLLTGLLYEIGPWDIASYLGTTIVLGSVALLATVIPAIRAATIAPVIVLQQD